MNVLFSMYTTTQWWLPTKKGHFVLMVGYITLSYNIIFVKM